MAGKKKTTANECGAAPERPAETLRIERLRMTDVVPSPDNRRKNITKAPDWPEFVENIRLNGVRVPIHVRPQAGTLAGYVIVAGERRWRAALDAGLKDLPAVLHETMTESDAMELTILENYGREDLTPIEQSEGVALLLERRNGDVRAVAALFGK
ncbi:MAG TPA: ParB/RepB/Spo0J family partition protein, partial [Acidobacteriaceae bacterium]|nr:ParB/RepB/Spo0J family partition protein [Acidobacteriaceae bacterium]